MTLTESQRDKIIEILKNELDPVFIYLFGSFAKGTAREDSDVDLAVYCDSVVGAYRLFMICGELSAVVGRDVQLVDLREASTVFASQVVGFREELYVKDRYAADEFNMTTLKMNATLNEERTIYLDKDNALLKDLKCLEEYAR